MLRLKTDLYRTIQQRHPRRLKAIKAVLRLSQEKMPRCLVKHWDGHRAGIWAMLMAFAGLRRGEMIGLVWGDIDLEKKTITVREATHFETNQPVNDKPKTPAGIRQIPLFKPLYEALVQLQPQVQPYSADTPVAISVEGKQLTKIAYRRGWNGFTLHLIKHGLAGSKGFHAHALRHTFATMLYDAGVDVKTAQLWLRHSDVATTMRIYTHLSKEKKGESIATANAFFEKWL